MAERQFINLTPHSVVIFKQDGTKLEIEPSGEVLRLIEEDTIFDEVEGITIIKRKFSPPEIVGVLYDSTKIVIVSLVTLLSLKDFDPKPTALVVAPDTGSGAVRDSEGKIIGTTRLITF